MTRAKLTALVGILLLALAGTPRAVASEPAEHPYLVLVGISKYADPQILPRAHAEEDAKAFYDLFTDPAYLGADAQHVKLLLGTPDAKRHSEPATHENIVKALRWATNQAGRDDLVVFLFIGEGAPLGERSCYFASDSTFKNRAKDAVAAGEIENAFEKLKSERFCAFIDVNFKGFDVPQGSAPDMNLATFYREFLGKTKENVKDDGDDGARGRMVFLANSGLRPSLDLPQHGLFEQVILDGLKGKADREGYEPDGEVTVDELADYVNKEMPELARQYGKTREQKEQHDFIMGARSVNFVITRNPAVAQRMRERMQKFESVAADLPPDLATEGRKLLRQMPKLEAQRSLRKEYQALTDGQLSVEDFKTARRRILDGTAMSRAAAMEYAAKVIQASEVLKKDYVKKINQGELIAAAVKGLYQRIDSRLPHDLRDRVDAAKGMSESELTDLIADARQRLGKREDLDNHKDVDFALQHMTQPLDPYTTYIDPETLGQFKRETQGNFTGIGIQIRVDSARDMIIVVTPIKGSPAYYAGLKTGDIITTIVREMGNDGSPLDKPEVISTKGLAITDAVKKIIGPPGTKVKLLVEREGVEHPLEFEITRGAVEVESVLGVRRKGAADSEHADDWDYLIDRDNKIAYVRLTSFARYTARDLGRVLEHLKNTTGIGGFILDLRFNPGGLLTSAVEISDMFIDDGVIVTIKPRVGNEATYTGEHDGSYLDFPMVCLVNGHSASGSEIVSACLQDHGRAVIVGERSYGKGSVQNIQPFDDGEIKLTTASFWRPSGKNLNRLSTSGKESDEWGVTPDKGYLLKLSRKERDELEEHLHKQEIIPRRDREVKEQEPDHFKDRQLDTALQYLRDQIKIASGGQLKREG